MYRKLIMGIVESEILRLAIESGIRSWLWCSSYFTSVSEAAVFAVARMRFLATIACIYASQTSASFIENMRPCREEANVIAEATEATFDFTVWTSCMQTRSCSEMYYPPRNNTIHTLLRVGYGRDTAVQEEIHRQARSCGHLKGILCGGTDDSTTRTSRKLGKIIEYNIGQVPICLARSCVDIGAKGLQSAWKIFEDRIGIYEPVESFEINASCVDGSRLISNGGVIASTIVPLARSRVPDLLPEDGEPEEPASIGYDYRPVVAVVCAVGILCGFVVLCIRSRKCKFGGRQDLTPPQKEIEAESWAIPRETLVAYLDPRQITLYEVIGQGSFGVVHRAEYLGSMVAAKILFQNAYQLDEFRSEINLLQSLRHPNIVQFLGTSFLDDYGVCALMEYMHKGDLTTILKRSRRQAKAGYAASLSWEQAEAKSKVLIALDVARGLAYLHGILTPVVHRDLKSRNILLSETFVAKISDFGVSRVISRTETMTAAGSTLWQAPEVLRGERFDEKADIYSYGVILSELDSEQLPYYDKYIIAGDGRRVKMNINAIAYGVLRGEFRPSFTPECPEEIMETAQQCLASNPIDRPSALELLDQLKVYSGVEDDRSIRLSDYSSITGSW